MRVALSMLLGLAVVCALTLTVKGEEKEKAKEVTIVGTITCAKCDLKLEKTCQTVIKGKVKDKDGAKELVYYFDEKNGKANHKKICTESKEGTVTGTVEEKDGKKIITVTKVEFK